MKNIYKFDFGITESSDGFIKITENTIYSESTGYGLTKPTVSNVRSKGDKKFLRDYVVFKEDNSFKVKIENGRYRIRISTGDYDEEGDVYVLYYINGKKMTFWIHDSEVLSKETTIDVTDGIIEITADKARHVCLNAVEIAPEIFLKRPVLKADIDVTADSQKVTLSWDEIEGASAYLVKRRRISDNEIDVEFISHNTSYIDYNVLLCDRFEYSVVPLDTVGFECAVPYVLPVYIIDGRNVTETVSRLAAKVTKNSVILDWIGTDGILCYNIYKKTPLGLSKFIASVKDTEYIDDEVVTCIPLEYTVEGITTSGTAKASITTIVKADKPKPYMETLNRGAVAVKTANGIFISWRLLGWEYDKGIDFVLYRNGNKLTEKPITDCTCYLDKNGKPGDEYTIRAVKDCKAEREGTKVTALETEYLPIKIDKPTPYNTPDGHTYEYYAGDVIPADIDGDGEYEFIVKWMANPRDNSFKGYSGVYYIDAYKIGKDEKLWRICLGPNIRVGAHYCQLMVYDFDNDGKAEIICKTADGTVDAAGNTVGNPDIDYRNKDGFIIDGPEYLSAFDGLNGTLLDTVPYEPPRGNVRDWGDSWGNRVDRFLACVAYLDGERPSVVMCRGYYDHGCPSVLAAYDLIDKKLIKKWIFRADKTQNINYTAQGHHSLYVGDVDGDGMDEIIYGSMAIDHDGTGMYSTGLGHGDAQHLGKFLPHAEGLQYFQIQEEEDAFLGYSVHNPATGEIKWGRYTGYDTARGMCAKIDPRYEGNQVWAIGQPLFSFKGEIISQTPPETCKFTVWWDGDLLRELLDYKKDEINWENGTPVIYKWDYINNKLNTIFEPNSSKCIQYTKGTPHLQADVLGDWRENLIYTDENCTELRIYTSTYLTNHRFYTLMHDHVYRLSVALQNTAYNTPPHTGFYIGDDMEKPPAPENRYVRGINMPEFTEDV